MHQNLQIIINDFPIKYVYAFIMFLHDYKFDFINGDSMMIPIILSGGSGTRLWPISRTKLPKQFCEIFKQSLHANTIERLSTFGVPWIITSQNLKDLTYRDAKTYKIPQNQIVLEPMARNTAPAIALICSILSAQNKSQEVVGVFPADHLIANEKKFQSALALATETALQNKIVTLGLKPSNPATGYGYIQIDMDSKMDSTVQKSQLSVNKIGSVAFKVEKFHEKPSIDLAKKFVDSGNYFWNAGIFIFKVSTMIEALKKYQPQLWDKINLLKSDLSNLKSIYEEVESISIDYAIMEKLPSEQLSCIPCDVGWSDVGSWDAIQEILGTDSPHKVEVQAKNNFVHSALNKKYAFIDVNDLIVVDTEDATLIAKKGSTQAVKDVVEVLKAKDSRLIQDHVFEHRPWGKYEILRDENHFKSKVIQVLPHEQISYQSHAKREEHWLVTQGVGEVILDDKVIPVTTGTYVKIPLGAKHRIRNTSNQIVEFVEVQLGSYFGEDDIVRYQDDYQRV